MTGARMARTAERRRQEDPPHRVVVVGGGFGGLEAVRHLRGERVEITLIDRRNFHLFQPLVYQLAAGFLSAGEIGAPLRGLFKRDKNVRVLLAEVSGFDLTEKLVMLTRLPNGEDEGEITYDSLIVAAGSVYTYFGHDEWRALAPDVKSVESALDVRRRLLSAFEAAEVEPDPEHRTSWLTFVVVGAGPTGVEIAGQIAELARDTMHDDFRSIETGAARILLVDTADRVLPAFPPHLSAKAARALRRLDVTPLLGEKVVAISPESVTVATARGDEREIPTHTVVWAAGVVASDLAGVLATDSEAVLGRGGRIRVRPDLSVPGHLEVSAVGDMVQVDDAAGNPVPLPGLAPVAMQQGRYAARRIRDRLHGRETPPFRYRNKGSLATIGRAKAVADLKHIRLSGFPAWLVWLFVHVIYLTGLQNRLVVLTRWTFAYLFRGAGSRLILESSRVRNGGATMGSKRHLGRTDDVRG
jgi:NADH:ubiquinone reductase (H+-translocating)